MSVKIEKNSSNSHRTTAGGFEKMIFIKQKTTCFTGG